MRHFGVSRPGNAGGAQGKPAARIVLICPDCGHENIEFADALRGEAYACQGDGCAFHFILAGRHESGRIAEAVRRLIATFTTLRGEGAS